MYCPKCGINLSEDSRFCHNCGTQVKTSKQKISETIQPEKIKKFPRSSLIVLAVLGISCVCLAILLFIGLDIEKGRISFFDLISIGFNQTTPPENEYSEVSETIENIQGALALSEQQLSILDEFDWPDTFLIIEIDDSQGKPVRLETWSYIQGNTSYTFIDGIFDSGGEAISLPDGYIPTPYHPDQFPLGSTPNEIQALIPDYPLERFESSETLLEGMDLYISGQLVLGFLEDRLFYVDAMAFVPNGDE